MVKSNKCENCGANLIKRGSGYYCEYCGSSYISKDNGVQDSASKVHATNMERPTMTEEVLREVAFPKSGFVVLIPVIAFAIMWCGTALVMAALTFSQPGARLMGIVPLLMGVFGSFIFIAVIKSALGPKVVRRASKLVEEGNWQAAYNLLKEDYERKITSQVGNAMIFISFYKFKDDESAKKYINDLNHLNYNGNAKIKEIASYLGVEYNRVSYAVHSEGIEIESPVDDLQTIASIFNAAKTVNRSHTSESGTYAPHGYNSYPRKPRD